MRTLRILVGIVSLLLIVAGFVAGIHEAPAYYDLPINQVKYCLGSIIGMAIQVACLWILYFVVATLVRLFKKKASRQG